MAWWLYSGFYSGLVGSLFAAGGRSSPISDITHHEAGPLVVSCVVERDADNDQESVWQVHCLITNTGSSPVAFLRIELPFEPKARTFLIALHDGQPMAKAMTEEYDAGIPALSVLRRMTLDPGGSVRHIVDLSQIIRASPEPGRYDISGIWRPTVITDGRRVTLTVPIPIVSFSLDANGRAADGDADQEP